MLGRETAVLRNDVATEESVSRMRPELIILSPGPGGPENTGNSMRILNALHGSIPFLGVCLGMQTIARCFGGRVTHAKEPVHGKMRLVHHNGEGLFAGLPNPLNATRYHSLVVTEASLADCLEATAWSEDGELMGLRHRKYPISGVQFHPEAYLTEGGMRLLGNALESSVHA